MSKWMMVVGVVLAGVVSVRAELTPAELRTELTNRWAKAGLLVKSNDPTKVDQGTALLRTLLTDFPVEGNVWRVGERVGMRADLYHAYCSRHQYVEAIPNGEAFFAENPALDVTVSVGHMAGLYLNAGIVTNMDCGVLKVIEDHPKLIFDHQQVIRSVTPGTIRSNLFVSLCLSQVGTQLFPKNAELATRYNRELRDGIPMFAPQSIQDAFALLTINDPTIPDDAIKKYIMDRSLPLIRRTLRAQGKTFVTQMVVEGGKTNAVNPMQPFIDRISVALNAPCCKGLEDALTPIGVVIEKPMDWSGVTASVTAWQDKLMNDGEGLGSGWANRAKTVLGVQGYNDFIKVYNEGEGKPSK